MMCSRKQIWIGIFIVLAALAALPFLRTGYVVRFMTTIFMYLALSQIWNILGGFTGYISLGLVGFVGMGAYTAAILMNLGVNIYLSMMVAGSAAALLSGIIGWPVLRLKAGYFSIATYGISFVLREIANNLTSVTGGGMGISFPLQSRGINQLNTYFYFMMLVLMLLVTLLCRRISRSSLGYGLLAIKEDEDAANVLGVNTTAYKIVAFCISSFCAAVVGAAYGYWLTFIEPVSAFDSNLSILVIIMAMAGGAGTVFGPILGSIVISIVSEVLWQNFMSLHQAILGAILIAVVIFMPRGILDIFRFRQEPMSLGYLKRRLVENIAQYRI